MTISEPSDDSVEVGSEVAENNSRKRIYSVSSGLSAEQYMSQLLTQKRFKINDEVADNEDDDVSSENDDSSGDESDESSTRAGSIKKLTLKNFMCHDHFELSLGPRMNFIIGRNGSGKSAILTGISVGLGAKATDTSRASSIKSLIKDGKSMARILIEIENRGLDSYEPETYGGSIIVERKLTRDGANAYAIKSENGALVSNKKKTLDEILQRFFIVVNNPLSFLSQDKARDFIANSTEQTRFNYFSEGTNIQSIISNYEEASRNILSMQKRSLAAKSYYDEACRKYMEAERVYKKYRHSHTLRQQLEKINGKIYWFNVEVLKRRIKKKEEEINEKLEKIEATESKISKSNDQIINMEHKQRNLEAEMSKLQQNYTTCEENNRNVQASYDDANRKVQSLRSDLLNYKSEIEDYGKQIEKHEQEIIAEQAKIDEATGGSKDLMTQRLQLLKKRHGTLTEARDKLQNELHDLDGNSFEMKNLNKELEDQKALIHSLRQKEMSLERSKKDRFAAFGMNIGFLIRDIDRETGWHQKPLGPIGYYVSVKDEYDQWGDLVNSILQKTLDSFIVCDEHDRNLLNRHMREKKIFKSIIVRKFEKFNYNNSATALYNTLLKILDIKDDDIKFTLIDSTGMEEMVICGSIAEAEDITKDRSVKQTFCLNDRRSGIRFTRRDGQLSRDPIFYSRDLQKLAGKVNEESIAEDLRDALNVEAQIQKRRNKLRLDEHEKKRMKQKELAEKKAQIKDICNQIFNAEHALNDEGDYGRIESLKGQIDSCKNHIKTREGMSVELLLSMKESKRKLATIKEELQVVSNAKEDSRNKMTENETELGEVTETIQLLRAEIENLNKTRSEISDQLEKLRGKLLKDNEKHDELCALANERCERSEVEILDSDTTESITEEFRNLQDAIEEAEKQNEKSFEEIQNEVLTSKAIKDQCEKSLVEVDNARITLENDLNSRFENLNITIKEKLARAKSSFEQSLALRGFKGKLEFDFGRKRVITEVQTKDNQDTRAVSTLSGGEKSFTQIAFLLSIWKVMKPRVCGLDEFDVFMDSVNRTIAIRLLIHELRNSAAQSIFITPQDIAMVGDLKDSEDVRIHRIKAPRND